MYCAPIIGPIVQFPISKSFPRLSAELNCPLFGFARAVQQKSAILQVGVPSEFLLMLPYIVTIIVVAGVVGKARPPAADGQPYIKQ